MPWWERRMLIEGLNAESEEQDEPQAASPSTSSTQPASAADLGAMGFTVKGG